MALLFVLHMLNSIAATGKGGNITLDTGLKKLQKEHKVMWTQGPDFSGKLIAQLNNFSTFIEESFKDILQLNLQTGSITLLRLTENYADYYCVKIMLGIEPHTLRKYLITVFGPVSVPHISRTQINITHSVNDVNCSLRCSVESTPGVTLSWYRGEKKINQTSSSDISTNLTLRLVIQDQDEGNYSCVAANPVSKEAVTLNSTLWCPPHDHKKMMVIIAGSIVGLLVLVLVCCVVKCYKRRKNGEEECFGMVNRTVITRAASQSREDGEENVEEQQDLLTAEDQHQNGSNVLGQLLPSQPAHL